MSLADLLDQIRDDPEDTPAFREAMRETLAELRRSGAADHALRIGDPFPDFLLPDTAGRLVERADLLADGPFVLTFFRGHWCPCCSAALREMAARLPEIAACGGTLVAVTPETGGRAAGDALGLRILTDVDHGLAISCGIAFRTPAAYRGVLMGFGLDLAERQGNAAWFLPVPATFVVDRGGMVRWSFVDTDFTRRAEPEDVVVALRALRPP